MNAQKDENGFLSTEQQNHRFLNVLQLVYLNAEKDKFRDGYFIPSDIISHIETELDFNTNEKTKTKIISEQIKKYRKRKSYLFWMDILSKGSYSSYEDAKSILIEINKKIVSNYNSITHHRYAMETLFLALDDYFGTSKVKISPSRFLTRKIKKNKNNKRKCGKKLTKKVATIKKLNSSALPF